MKAGIYIHIPFCKSRCSYCDFATDVYRSNDAVERYVSALCEEITNYELLITNYKNRKPKTENQIETIYFGGGTPSLLTVKQLEKILNSLHKTFSVEENIEFTLEMNPATVTLEKLQNFKSLGINRASFGVQTFDDKALKLLARGHDAADARKTFELLRKANFENISFDLIGGLPNQTLENWNNNLTEALKLQPEHLSLYLLEIHEGTPLAEQIRSQRHPQPDEDLAAAMYEMMLEMTAEKGFEQYEISNFSKPNLASKHNTKYWLCEPVFAFGVSAHSFDGQKRWSNERDTNQYVSLIENGKSAITETTELDKKQLSGEFAFLRLRLAKGLNLEEYEKKFGINLREDLKDDLTRLSEANLIKFDENFLKLTRQGMLYSNEVFAVFV
ncbi:MAG TPA: radical SAM family heme chaperone HemW [Pyrinomonadaceae bacterium]|nr:radical SAM family heme chaperone HemW [Pyrinomonadaceae bacterium]